MSTPKHADVHPDVHRAAKLLQKRETDNVYRKIAVERKLKAMPAHVVHQAKAQVETINMEPEHILSIGEGITPAGYIQNQVNLLKEAIHMYWGRYRDGLANFETAMVFSSEDEAQSHYLNSALKALAKVDLDLFLEGLADGCEELAVPIKMAKELITAELEEHERVEKAEGEVKISEFIQHTRTQVGQFEMNDAQHLDDLGKNVQIEYQKVAADSGGQSSVISGDGAVMLEHFEASAKRFKRSVEAKTTAIFQEQFTEAFAKTGARLVGPVTAGIHENATLYLDCRAHFSDGKWELTDIDDSWVLMTNAPKPDRVVSGLKSSLKEQNRKIVDSPLRKVVKATLDIDSGHWYESDSYDDVYIKFTDINDVDYETSDVSLHGNNPKEATDAWNAVIKAKVAATEEVHGKNG